MKKEDIGWLAGIIDGEGNFTIRCRVTHSKILNKDRLRFWIELTIVNTDINVINKLEKILTNLNIKYRRYYRDRKIPNSKRLHMITLSTKRLQKLIPFIEKEVSKQKEIKIIKNALNIISNRKKAYISNENLKKLNDYRKALLEIHGNQAKKLARNLVKKEYLLTEEDLQKLKNFYKERCYKMLAGKKLKKIT